MRTPLVVFVVELSWDVYFVVNRHGFEVFGDCVKDNLGFDIPKWLGMGPTLANSQHYE
jgi:hypothetical protein